MPDAGKVAYDEWARGGLADTSGDNYPPEWENLLEEKKALWRKVAKAVQNI